MPARPSFANLRSAIVIIETDTGETMQAILSPSRSQPVEVQVESNVEYVYDGVLTKAIDTTWTVTIVAGVYFGQLRTGGASAFQADPPAVYP